MFGLLFLYALRYGGINEIKIKNKRNRWEVILLFLLRFLVNMTNIDIHGVEN